MLLEKVLRILAACIGFISGAFLIWGTVRMKPRDIVNRSRSFFDASPHLLNALTRHRADYITGALLLTLAFFVQLAANLLPEELSMFQLPNAFVAIGCVTILILAVAIAIRWMIVRNTQQAVRQEEARENVNQFHI
jgi:hypothetical protein